MTPTFTGLIMRYSRSSVLRFRVSSGSSRHCGAQVEDGEAAQVEVGESGQRKSTARHSLVCECLYAVRVNACICYRTYAQ